ncbi:hypothetical protein BH11PSE11_BH11PSE11_15330 [soil metagenome]
MTSILSAFDGATTSQAADNLADNFAIRRNGSFPPSRLATSALPRIALITLALLLGACATPPDPVRPRPIPVPRIPEPIAPAPAATSALETLRALVAQQDRLDRVAAPLLTSNTQLCKARNLLGFTAKNKYSYTDEFVDAAHQLLDLGDRLQITGIMADSGAARAGVRRGDVLLAIESQVLPQGPNAEAPAKAILAPLVKDRNAIKLTLLRNGASHDLNVPLTSACAFRVEFGNADHANAYADGMRVMVTRGLMNFTTSDEELAYILAREMAHNALGHPVRERMTATTGSVIDNLVRMHPDLTTTSGSSGIKQIPPAMEALADKVALYMLVRAGYGIDNYQSFWQRLAVQYPASVANAYTAIHPASEARVSMIRKTLAEIKSKQSTRKPLLP